MAPTPRVATAAGEPGASPLNPPAPSATVWARLGPLTDRLLPLWFLAWSAWRLWDLGFVKLGWEVSWFGRDFRIYRNAAVALLEGGDPWAAFDRWNGVEWHFAALPVTAQLFVPFAWLPEGVGLATFFAATVALALLGLRALRLPAWWLLFPPLMEGLAAANPQVLLLGLLLLGARSGVPQAALGRARSIGGAARAAGRAVAVGLKVYALVPIVARREWTAVAMTGALFAGSVAIAPGLWASYAGQFTAVSARLAEQAHGGVSAALLLDPAVFGPPVERLGALAILPGLALYGLVALLVLLVAVRDVRAAGWIAVPLLWPAAEYHYATFALPVARRLSIWVLAIATLPTYLLGLILLAYEIIAARRAMVPEPGPVSLATWLGSLRPGRSRRPGPPVAADTPPTPAS